LQTDRTDNNTLRR